MSETLLANAIPVSEPQSHAHEGIMAGALGATVAWLWFLISNWMIGSPWHVLGMFGQGLLDFVGAGDRATWVAVSSFTVVFFAYWCLLAVIILKFVHAAKRTPSILGLAVTLFILSQFFFAGVTAIFSSTGLGLFAWTCIYFGNLAGFVAAWSLIVRFHPEIREEARHMNEDV